MNITPRNRFQEVKERAQHHRDLVVSAHHLTAADSALLQMISEMADSTDPAVAIAGYHRIMGARKYMEAYSNLAETKPLPAAKDNYNLNHALK